MKIIMKQFKDLQKNQINKKLIKLLQTKIKFNQIHLINKNLTLYQENLQKIFNANLIKQVINIRIRLEMLSKFKIKKIKILRSK